MAKSIYPKCAAIRLGLISEISLNIIAPLGGQKKFLIIKQEKLSLEKPKNAPRRHDAIASLDAN